jgi:hypothetical protein
VLLCICLFGRYGLGLHDVMLSHRTECELDWGLGRKQEKSSFCKSRILLNCNIFTALNQPTLLKLEEM